MSSQLMYHGTSRDNRQNITKYGLLRSKSEAIALGGNDGIFLASKPTSSSEYIDVWSVNVVGLNLVPDDTTIPEDEEDEWYVTYDEDIPPSRLRLLL